MARKDTTFGTIDKLAYAAGDFGCNMSFALKTYITIYWTQYMGIDSVMMSGLLIIVQVWDAINDPLIGAVVDADHKQYKRNKFLQYIWVGSIGLLVAGAFCYLPFQGAAYWAKCIMFVAGYMLWDAFYTIANVPYGSVISLISDNPNDRAELSTWRSVGSMAGNILTSIVVPMVIYDENSDLRGGLMFPMALIMGLIGFACFQFMIKNTVVRVDTEVKTGEEAPNFNFLKGIKNFITNRAALGATLAPVGMFLGMYGASTATTVMFQSYFNAASLSGVFSMISYIPVFIYPFVIDKLVTRFGKKELCAAGSVLMCIGYALVLIVPIPANTTGLIMYALFNLIAGFGSGMGNCLVYSLMADATDYNEWKHGTREEGTTYALHSFFRKLAQGIGPSVGLLLCAALGYDESLGAAQTAQTAVNMRYLSAGMYLFGGVIQLIGYALVYPLDKKTTAQMNEELNERHAAQAAGTDSQNPISEE